MVNWDFPFGFLPTTGIAVFRDFLPVPAVCKSFFRDTFGFFRRERCFDAVFGSNALFLLDVKTPPP
jgi:hypothetical protein